MKMMMKVSTTTSKCAKRSKARAMKRRRVKMVKAKKVSRLFLVHQTILL
jgi:hypothetical protein